MALDSNGDGPLIKMEHGQSIEPDINPKAEFDVLSTGPQFEEDIYEDAGDLDFTSSKQHIFLTRLPKFLWTSWSQMDDDTEIHLGTMRVEGDLDNPKRMSLLLSSTLGISHNVPKEYNMQIQNWTPPNTFVFTEKNLPGYVGKSRISTKYSQDSASMPFSQVAPRLGFQDRGRLASSKLDKNVKWQPYYKKAIPKKTSLAGKVQMELNCLPVETQEYRELMDQRTRQALTAKRETQLLPGLASSHAGNLLAPGTLGAPGSFNNFIKTSGTQRGKAQEAKAARMPQNELVDLILDCFKRYNYWPLKSLKAEVNQPEAYLKQTLEKVAHLVRQGTHAMTWQLKQEYQIGSYAGALAYDQALDRVAPDNGYNIDGTSDTGDGMHSDDDENMQLEDVMPG
ncbi:hypothetical protein MMC26_007671 [Xylographa opegraphella]|nr:hypothetical protein [Xylographa opegraphella]